MPPPSAGSPPSLVVPTTLSVPPVLTAPPEPGGPCVAGPVPPAPPPGVPSAPGGTVPVPSDEQPVACPAATITTPRIQVFEVLMLPPIDFRRVTENESHSTVSPVVSIVGALLTVSHDLDYSTRLSDI